MLHNEAELRDDFTALWNSRENILQCRLTRSRLEISNMKRVWDVEFCLNSYLATDSKDAPWTGTSLKRKNFRSDTIQNIHIWNSWGSEKGGGLKMKKVKNWHSSWQKRSSTGKIRRVLALENFGKILGEWQNSSSGSTFLGVRNLPSPKKWCSWSPLIWNWVSGFRPQS